MKIAGQDNIGAIAGAARSEAAGARRAGEGGGDATTSLDADPAGSSLTLSPRSEEASRVTELAKAAPDFRIDLVEEARADLAAGRMEPDSAAIAQKMAQEMF